MDNLRNSIRVLFEEVIPEQVLANLFLHKEQPNLIPNERFCAHFGSVDSTHTQDEVWGVFQMVDSNWTHTKNTMSYQQKSKSVFNVLSAFSNQALYEKGNEVVCKFEHLLRWRETVLTLEEDLFKTSFLASKDIYARINRTSFSWHPVTLSDNTYLQTIFNRGLTDLHTHLKGSSFHFDLSWLSLMNHVENRADEFKSLQYYKQDVSVIHEEDLTKRSSLHNLVTQAAAIRSWLFVFSLTNGEAPSLSEEENLDLTRYLKDPTNVSLFKTELQQHIDLLRHKYNTKITGYTPVDYAILPNKSFEESDYYREKGKGQSVDHQGLPEDAHYLGNLIFSGERALMYRIFRIIFEDTSKNQVCQQLFYAYLLIKYRFRKELIQNNSKIGFDNFADYESRKECFIWSSPLYTKLLHNLAVKNSFYRGNLHYLESRIVPKESVKDNFEQISKIDKYILAPELIHGIERLSINHPRHLEALQKSLQKSHAYIFHFIKRNSYKELLKEIADKQTYSQSELLLEGNCRSQALRKEVKTRALAVNEMRKQVSPTLSRIVGIDAANTEIGCRPEVFAQAFRYLKAYSFESPLKTLVPYVFPKLMATYHAGEDFLDLTDGLRAIDDVLRFLNFERGDRIGHAIALGVSASEYYKLKQYRVVLPKQELLDNIAWVLNAIARYGLRVSSQLQYQLENKFTELFRIVYRHSTGNPSMINIYDTYFKSYSLRGDDPELYQTYSNIMEERSKMGLCFEDCFNPTNFWMRCGLNKHPESIAARREKDAIALYLDYHYNSDVKKNGVEFIEFCISNEYIGLIEQIQQKIQFELRARQVAIEGNPSSNQKIGPYNFFENHPILKFANSGLTYNEESLRLTAQLSTSINTDDQGVFATSIENEYALMAIALTKAKDMSGDPLYTDRFIYDWLEGIRQNGHEQRFRS